MSVELTPQEREAVNRVHTLADELARAIKDVGEIGFTIQFNINGQLGVCDVFNVFKMVAVDMRAGAN